MDTTLLGQSNASKGEFKGLTRAIKAQTQSHSITHSLSVGYMSFIDLQAY